MCLALFPGIGGADSFLVQPVSNGGQRLARFRDARVETVPDMDHVRSFLQGDVQAFGTRPGGKAARIVQQGFGSADL